MIIPSYTTPASVGVFVWWVNIGRTFFLFPKRPCIVWGGGKWFRSTAEMDWTAVQYVSRTGSGLGFRGPHGLRKVNNLNILLG
jgi:hypothetical protein